MLTSLFASCSLISDLEKPESLTLKTHATYQMPLGYANAYLKDHMSAKKLQKIIDENAAGQGYEGLSVYEYTYSIDNRRTDTSQKFIIDYPIMEVPLDISSYLENLGDLDISSGGSNTFSQEFKTTDLGNVEMNQDVDLGIDRLFKASDFEFDLGGIAAIPILGKDSQADSSIPQLAPYFSFEITAPEYNTIKYKSGSFDFTFTPDNPSTSMVLKLNIEIEDSRGRKLTATGGYQTLSKETGNWTVKVPLENVSLPRGLRFRITGTFAGGGAGNIVKFTPSLKLSDDAKVSEITGLTVPDSELTAFEMPVNVPVDMSQLSNYLVSADIGSGYLEYGLKIPESWSGVVAKPSLSISGGINVTETEFGNGQTKTGYAVYKKVQLDGKKILPMDLQVQGKLGVSIKNATIKIDYDENGDAIDRVTFDAKANISEFKNAKLKMKDLMDSAQLHKQISQSIPEGVANYISSIKFNQVGLQGTVNTDLPKNDMALKAVINSTYFEMSDLNDSLIFDGNTPYKLDMVQKYSPAKNCTISAGLPIDFDVLMSLSGTDPVDSSIVTFDSILMGHTYNFDFDVKFIYDWGEVVLKTSSVPLQGDFDSGFNIRKMLEDSMKNNDAIDQILEKVKFGKNSVRGRLTVTKPEGFDAVSGFTGFQGTIDMDCDGNVSSLLMSNDINFVSVTKGMSQLADKDLKISQNIYERIPASVELNMTPLLTMLNDKPESVKLKYDLQMGSDGNEVTILKSDIEHLKNSGKTTSIKMSITLIVALELYIDDDIFVEDLFTLFGKGIEEGSDILHRENKDDVPFYKEYTDLIRQLGFYYIFENNTGLTITSRMIFKNSEDVEYLTGEDKKLQLISSTEANEIKNKKFHSWSKLVFTKNDINTIFDNWPFSPRITLEIPKSKIDPVTLEPETIKITPSAFFGARGIFEIKTDGEFELWGGDD